MGCSSLRMRNGPIIAQQASAALCTYHVLMLDCAAAIDYEEQITALEREYHDSMYYIYTL